MLGDQFSLRQASTLPSALPLTCVIEPFPCVMRFGGSEIFPARDSDTTHTVESPGPGGCWVLRAEVQRPSGSQRSAGVKRLSEKRVWALACSHWFTSTERVGAS